MPKKRLSDPFSSVALGTIRAYQVLIRPLLAGSGGCRFVPSCSDYAIESIQAHGAVRGGWLALRRLLRCHPFGGHGVDLLP
jgi:putative membrane protein insertion efficiency factor